MKYNKLVRDKIPEIIEEKGKKALTHVADETEYWEKLKAKLLEEFEEFKKDENMEEFADILEVLDAIAAFKDFDAYEVKRMKDKKAAERGRFEKRIILEES